MIYHNVKQIVAVSNQVSMSDYRQMHLKPCFLYRPIRASRLTKIIFV